MSTSCWLPHSSRNFWQENRPRPADLKQSIETAQTCCGGTALLARFEVFQSYKENSAEQDASFASIKTATAPTSTALAKCISLNTDGEKFKLMGGVSDKIQHDKTREQTSSNKRPRKRSNRKTVQKSENCSFQIKCIHQRCTNLFNSSDAMDYHVMNYHAQGIKKTFSCHLCKKTFHHLTALCRHSKGVHTGLRPFKCQFDMCFVSYITIGDLNKHIKSVHGAQTQRYSNAWNARKYSSTEHHWPVTWCINCRKNVKHKCIKSSTFKCTQFSWNSIENEP